MNSTDIPSAVIASLQQVDLAALTAIANEIARLATIHGDSIPTTEVIDGMCRVLTEANPRFSDVTFRRFIAAAVNESARWEA
jgi:hypothetical protein